MSQTLSIQLNGQHRDLQNIEGPTSLSLVLAALELKLDRVAVELNGEIVRRANWADTGVKSGDRLEVVHFVGGGRAA